MTIDQKGRLIISPQQGTGNLLRVTLSRDGQVKMLETIDQPVGSAMGLLYAFGSLYVNGEGLKGLGLYRLHDNRAQDRYDSVKLIKNIEGAAGEHGSHAVVLGPDKHLYIVNGNFTKVPKDISPDSPHKNYAEDQLLPRAADGNGFGNGVQPPGGFFLRTDKDGKKWELFAAGTRNTYDFAFNTDGEMFAFDSDMEWDWGTPWYRPIRICHIVSAGDYGFREGTGKWPKYYPDSLPSTVDVGVGSPTGLKFGTDSKFPEKYKKALYALDWSYGRIFAVHFTPDGASYDATFETFLRGKPLNLTDIEFGKDGAMYFITGGRGTQSGLYRVSYIGPKEKNDESGASKEELKIAAKARELRRKIEHFQGRQDPTAVPFAWPYLNSDDRFIRYAARMVIESQPVAEWKDRAISENRTNAGITALLALARCGGKETQRDLLKALAKFPLDNLSEAQQLEKLRVIELSFIRQGKPDPDLVQMAIDKLDRHYPAKSEWLNRELCELLIYLQAPDVVTKTLALLDAAPTQEEQIHYILHLRKVKTGWTTEQRQHYFGWFKWEHEWESGESSNSTAGATEPWSSRNGGKPQHPAQEIQWFTDANREYADGSSFPKFIANFRKDAIDSLTDAERTELEPYITDKKPEETKPVVEHKFVKDWKMADLQPLLEQLGRGRSFAKGKEAFTAAQCAQCHRFDNQGGAIGPELTAISSRFGHRDILESILEPSKVISEQFQNIVITKKDGDDVTGRILEENDQKVIVITNPLTQTKVEVLKSDIEKRAPSKVSPMPEGLVNNLTKEEILDLIAYLESGGKETAAAFLKK
jgi:putative heme-binding domain-containing protein